MEKKSPAKPDAVESPTALDGALLTDFTAGAEKAPTLHDNHLEVDEEEEEAEQPMPEKKPEKTLEKKKERTSSIGVNKSKETLTASSSRKTTADSSHTESAGTEPKAAEKQEASEEGCSGNAGGEDEEVVNDHDQDEEEDDVLYTEERPAKKAKTVTRSSRRGKAPTTSAKEIVKNKEVVVPKRLDYALLERLRVRDDVKRMFQGIRWGMFLEWDTTVYAPLMKEFYGDLDIDHNKGVPEGIHFTVLGERREFTVNDLNQALKMVTLMEAKAASYN